MQTELIKIAQENYELASRNRRAEKYSRQVEYERAEKFSRLGALFVLVLLVICCAVCGVH